MIHQNDQSNNPYFISKKYHPSHNKHVEIDLFKMIKWSIWFLSKLDIFLLDLSIKKPKILLMLVTIGATNKNLGKSTTNLSSQCRQSHGHPKIKLPFQCVHHTISHGQP
jgi:hypothetical protein